MLSAATVISNRISKLASQFSQAIMHYIYDQHPRHLQFMTQLIHNNPPAFLKHQYGASHDDLVQFIINCPSKYHPDLPETADKIRLDLLWTLNNNLPRETMSELLLSISHDNRTPFLCAVDSNSADFFQKFIPILASTITVAEMRVQFMQPHLEQTTVLHNIAKTGNVNLLQIYEGIMVKYFDVPQALALLDKQMNTADHTGAFPFSTDDTSQNTSPNEYKQTSTSSDTRLDKFMMPVDHQVDKKKIPQNNNEEEECVAYLPPDLFIEESPMQLRRT